jgi:hypothetical protein
MGGRATQVEVVEPSSLAWLRYLGDRYRGKGATWIGTDRASVEIRDCFRFRASLSCLWFSRFRYRPNASLCFSAVGEAASRLAGQSSYSIRRCAPASILNRATSTNALLSSRLDREAQSYPRPQGEGGPSS